MILTITLNASIDKTVKIDDFKKSQINRIDRPVEMAGGKGLNVTRALKAFDIDSIATGLMGGKSGERLKELLNRDNITHNFFSIKDQTRSCLALINNNDNSITEINENGPCVTVEELEGFYKKVDELSKLCKVAVISGSVPKSVSENVYYDLIEICKKNNLLTALDARGVHLKNGTGAYPYIIKPNQFEAEELLGFKIISKDDYFKSINFLTHYCQIAVVTLEDKGCIIGTKQEIYKIQPPSIKVVNSVGCGDSFLAGMLYAISQNKSLSDIGVYGVSAGSANALTETAGLCNKSDIDNILKNIQVEKLL